MDGIAKDGKRFRLRLWVAGRIRKATFATRIEAENARDALRARGTAERLGLPPPEEAAPGLTLRAAFDAYLHEAEHARKVSRKHLNAVRYSRTLIWRGLGDSHPARLTRADVTRFVIYLREHSDSKGRLIQLTLTHLRAALRYSEIPIPTLPRIEVPPRAPKTLRVEELRRFLLELQPGSPERLFAEIALRLALRESEVRGLRVGDVDLAAGTLTVTRRKGRAGTRGSEEVLPLTATLAALLAPHVASLPADVAPDAPLLAWVLKSGERRPLRQETVRRSVEDACRRAGVPVRGGLGWLRAQAATLARTSGESLRTVSQALGHADTRLTLGHYDESNRITLEAWSARVTLAAQIDAALSAPYPDRTRESDDDAQVIPPQ